MTGKAIEHDRRQELALLDALLKGDRQAGKAMVARYGGQIEMSVRQVFRRSGVLANSDEVRDMVAEVWLSLLDHDMRSLRRFDPTREIKLATWLALLARNKTIDHLRASRRRFLPVDATDRIEAQLGSSPSPAELVEHKERSDIAASALDHLGHHDRRFLEAWYLEERPPRELAHEFGIAVGTVYSRRFKIQQKLTRLVGRVSRVPRGATMH